MTKAVSHSILTAYPPLATNHHGVQFVEFVIGSSRILQRSHIVKYLDSLCSQKEGYVRRGDKGCADHPAAPRPLLLLPTRLLVAVTFVSLNTVEPS